MKKGGVAILFCVFLLSLMCSCAGRKPKPSHTKMKQLLNSYIGTPYRWGGMDHNGIDCSGLVVKAYAGEGITLPRTVEGLYRAGRKVDKDDLVVGDLLFFNTKTLAGMGICICPLKLLDVPVPLMYGQTHVGIYMGNGSFIHAVTSKGVIVSRLKSQYWRERLIAARRIFL